MKLFYNQYMAKQYNLKEAKALLDGADIRCANSANPRMSAMTYIMRHMRDRGLEVDESPADFVNWEEFYCWFYSDRFVTVKREDQ